ncbi:hypothetical protein IWQ57_004775, partial [Coemansia nantahalensis]
NILELGAARRLTFWLVGLESFAVYTGYWALTFYIGSTVKLLGGSHQTGSNMLLVLNAGSAVGRVLAGVVADRFGCVNTLLLSYILTVLVELPLWLSARSMAPLYVLCALYGMISPTFISLNSVIVARYFDTDSLATVMGMVNVFSGVGGLAGNLAQGDIYDRYDRHKGFTNTAVFSAMFILFAALVTLALRVHVVRKGGSRRLFQVV